MSLSFSSFQDESIPEVLRTTLKNLKFVEPTPIQKSAIPLVLSGKDMIACAQTGTGKTLAFTLPIVMQILDKLMKNPKTDEQALVVVPTREIALQVAEVFQDITRNANLRGAVLIGGMSFTAQSRYLNAKPHIIIATPGRLCDHMEQRRGLLDRVRYVVLDEADRMLDMGFMPSIRIIMKAVPQDRQTLLFSATMPTEIRQLAMQFLRKPEQISIGTVSKPTEKVEQLAIKTTNQDKNHALLNELTTREGSVLIFARTKRRVDRLTTMLKNSGHKATLIHGDRSQSQRNQALDLFRKGNTRILVATDIAARGIDVPHIAYVINYDLPMTSEEYVHRIGRTGRAGATGTALSLITPEDRSMWTQISRMAQSKR
jgi:superfamily II DNA/RNA helicase